MMAQPQAAARSEAGTDAPLPVWSQSIGRVPDHADTVQKSWAAAGLRQQQRPVGSKAPDRGAPPAGGRYRAGTSRCSASGGASTVGGGGGNSGRSCSNGPLFLREG